MRDDGGDVGAFGAVVVLVKMMEVVLGLVIAIVILKGCDFLCMWLGRRGAFNEAL